MLWIINLRVWAQQIGAVTEYKVKGSRELLMRPPNFPVTQVKGLYFKNPFVVLPSPTPLTNPNGRVTPELLMHYKALARSEAAMIIAGPAAVVPPNSRKTSLLRVDQPKYLDGLRALCKIIESNGAFPAIQIVHPGDADADDVLAGVDRFCQSPEEHVNDRLINIFKNACARSVEVGFRYVELGACGHLLLHQMVHEDREDMLRTIFKNAVRSMVSGHFLGIRFHPKCQNVEKYVRAFLELGGDIICYEPVQEQVETPQVRKDNSMINLHSYLNGKSTRELLTFHNLVGLPASFPHKTRQIEDYFR